MNVTKAKPKGKDRNSGRLSGKKFSGDLPLVIAVLLVSAFGVICVYSASYYVAEKQYGDKFFFAKKQLIGFIAGAIALVFTSLFDYHKLKNKLFRYIFYGVSALLLALVFVPGIGKSNYGATRWIGAGGFTLQPSEIAKFSLVVFIAGYASDDMGRIAAFRGMLPVLAAGGGFCALIIFEPNM